MVVAVLLPLLYFLFAATVLSGIDTRLFYLLYLNEQTFAQEDGALVDEVERACAAGACFCLILFTTDYSLLTTHYSLLTTYYLLLIT